MGPFKLLHSKPSWSSSKAGTDPALKGQEGFVDLDSWRVTSVDDNASEVTQFKMSVYIFIYGRFGRKSDNLPILAAWKAGTLPSVNISPGGSWTAPKAIVAV